MRSEASSPEPQSVCRRVRRRGFVAALSVAVGALVVVGTAGCGSASQRADERTDGETSPRIVVTSNILAEQVTRIGGDDVVVETLMSFGADPHHFSPSARQAAAMESADLVVINGGGFEAGMQQLIDNVTADGANVFVAIDHVDPRHADGDEHPGDDGDDDGDDHAEELVDPHFWTDPVRMAAMTDKLAAEIAALDGVDADAIAARAAEVAAELELLDDDVAASVAAIAPDERLLVTNHEALGYFAERYGFTVIGTVIPSLTTNAEPSARDIEQLVAVVREHRVRAVFVDTTGSTAFASALAREVGNIDGSPVEVVELYVESLGPPGSPAATYDSMIRTDTERIVQALTVGDDAGETS